MIEQTDFMMQHSRCNNTQHALCPYIDIKYARHFIKKIQFVNNVVELIICKVMKYRTILIEPI